jgi:putative hemolysin
VVQRPGQVESTYPASPEALPERILRESHYEVRFAHSRDELDSVLQLRFEVFNLELGEGLATSYETGRDADEYDDVCHHLMVVDTRNEELVGSYRMQTAEMADRYRGFYSSTLFDLSALPANVRRHSMEIGRACVARSHRSSQVLFLLWKGLAVYVAHNQLRYLFGCCSLTSQSPAEGWSVMHQIEAKGHLHEELAIVPRSRAALEPLKSPPEGPAVQLPILFRTYLRYGAKVCGPPAIDRDFKTIDYLVLLDVDSLGPRIHRMFFG